MCSDDEVSDHVRSRLDARSTLVALEFRHPPDRVDWAAGRLYGKALVYSDSWFRLETPYTLGVVERGRMHQRTAHTGVVTAVIVGLAALLAFSLLPSPVALAHTCGASPLNLKTGETGSYTISADGIATNYEVVNDDSPDVASITPDGSFSATDGVFTITALKMGVNLILIFWDAPEFNESDLCLLDVRVLDSSVAPTATAAPEATPTATPTSTPVVGTPTPTATPTPTPHANKDPRTDPWPDITAAEEKAV